METVTDFLFLGSTITTDGDCSHEIKTLTSWKESYVKKKGRGLKEGILFKEGMKVEVRGLSIYF